MDRPERPNWAPADIALERPSAARMYDYYLGGAHNFAIDRQAADQALALWPELPLIMQANRAFLRRAIQYLSDRGIDRFLDIGSGIPTVGNVHEIALAANPAARVVYVDLDPVAVAHSRAILGDEPRVTVVQADARRMGELLAHPAVRELLAPGRPVAALLLALLHFIPDDAAADALVRQVRDALPPGSYLALSHASTEGMPAESEVHERLYARTATPMRMRTRAEIARFFAGMEPVEPGVVYLPLWRPEGPDDLFLAAPERCTGFAGVAGRP